MIERQGNPTTKQENTTDTTTTTTNTTSSAPSWSRSKDPRIVRVSRAFGGKDRHSKVCTVRGLRDRRVRLSVPTAIQLYDLQDRLGLNQPSKVVDWLLDAAKHEIDGLPPLQFPILTPHHGFIHPHSNSNSHSHSQSAKHGLKISSDFNPNPRVFSGEASERNDDHDPYNFLSSRQQNQNQNQNHTSFASLLAPFNSWDPSSLTLSQPPGLTAQHDQGLDNFTLHHPPPHFLVYQPTQPYLQPVFHTSELSNSDSGHEPVVRPFRFSNEQNKHDAS